MASQPHRLTHVDRSMMGACLGLVLSSILVLYTIYRSSLGTAVFTICRVGHLATCADEVGAPGLGSGSIVYTRTAMLEV